MAETLLWRKTFLAPLIFERNLPAPWWDSEGTGHPQQGWVTHLTSYNINCPDLGSRGLNPTFLCCERLTFFVSDFCTRSWAMWTHHPTDQARFDRKRHCASHSAHVVPVSCNNRVFPSVLIAASVNAILGVRDQLIQGVSVRWFLMSPVRDLEWIRSPIPRLKYTSNTNAGLKGSHVSAKGRSDHWGVKWLAQRLLSSHR